MFDGAGPRVFGLPPGADFPRALAGGVMDRMAGLPPEALARVTVFLNTTRMLNRVRAAFAERGPLLLPRLRLVTDLAFDPLAGLPPPVPKLRRRLELARLVGELVSREADFAPGTAVYGLADSLADLLDEMQSEAVPPEALERPDLAEDHAAHWERSLRFLRIVAPFYADDNVPDPGARQRRLAEVLAARWAAVPPADPVIVAASTGSRGATAVLMEAVARLPQGALVLPGFDFDMPDFGWNSLDFRPVPNEDHPQYRFAALFARLGIAPRAVRDWGAGAAPDAGRNRLVSLALRPAPVTDQWLREGAALGPVAPLCEGLSLIEAPDPRAEALAIALSLREAAHEGRRATLITPDRALARRVTAALDRWRIRPDDSAGRPLHLSPPGRFLRHVAGLFGRPMTIEALLTLLKHPLTNSGAGDRGNHLRLTRDLELHLRRHGPPFPTGDTLRAWAENDAGRQAWAGWLADWICDLPDSGGLLSALAGSLRTLAERLAAGPGGDARASELWQAAAGRQARAAVALIAAEAGHGGEVTPAAFAELLTAVLRDEPVRETDAAHPLISIQGTREARELQADLVILGGLNEGVWPGQPAPDPWLSRQMRLKLGLLLPERQIGLAAHDFQLAAAAPRAILSRALRDDEAQTVPSRWLDRLTNLITGLDGEEGAIRAMRGRGRRWVDLAARLEQAAAVPPARRPSPRPPVAARPRELPVTAITRLIRDPYAVYARYVLRLKPLDPLVPEPDARLRGRILHEIFEGFVRGRPPEETTAQARDRLLALAEDKLAADIAWPSMQRLWLARIARVAGRFVADEARRATAGQPAILEQQGRIRLESVDFTLTARPDRIDLLKDGRVHIYDYKSGRPPTDKQLAAFEKQLPLEAAMAERGGFTALGPRRVDGVTFIQLGGEGEVRSFGRDVLDPDAEWARLGNLIGRYLRADQGFAARRAMFQSDQAGDYDHLARRGEWDEGDPPAPEDVA